jgi:hypothetical protein
MESECESLVHTSAVNVGLMFMSFTPFSQIAGGITIASHV